MFLWAINTNVTNFLNLTFTEDGDRIVASNGLSFKKNTTGYNARLEFLLETFLFAGSFFKTILLDTRDYLKLVIPFKSEKSFREKVTYLKPRLFLTYIQAPLILIAASLINIFGIIFPNHAKILYYELDTLINEKFTILMVNSLEYRKRLNKV